MLLVDGHTHLHDHVDIKDFLSSASASLRQSSRTGNNVQIQAALCLADFAGAEGFKRLSMATAGKNLPGWQTETTADDCSLCLTNNSGDRIWIIAGRQIVTREKLEVMALGTAEVLPDDLSLSAAIDAVAKCGAMPILPWGVGKWLGKRGGYIKSAMNDHGKHLALCDNGGRPWFWRPNIFPRARQMGITVISGTDPLRIASDCLRVGSFGQTFPGEIDQSPVKWIKEKIFKDGEKFHRFGKPMSIAGFAARQYLLRKESRS